MPDMKPLIKERLRYSAGRVRDGLVMAGVCMAVTYPCIYYQSTHLIIPGLRKLTAEQERIMIIAHALMIFGAALISAMIGLHYAEQLKLPGLGDIRRVKLTLLFIALGLICIPFSYFFADRFLLSVKPELFPKIWYYVFAHVLGQSIPQEVILRFGLVTIVVYLWRFRKKESHPWMAGVIVSLFAILLFMVTARNIGIRISLDLPILLGVMAVFAVNFALSEIYIRCGLLAAMAFHLGLQMKYIAYALLG